MTGKLVRENDLTANDRDAMYALLAEHFEGVQREQFDRDLAEKNWVVLVEQDAGLAGFSTILAYETAVGGEALSVICSGDTIVAPAAWGSAAFPRTWIQSVYHLRTVYPNGRLLWLLLTSGYRTYRFLPVFWREFYPRPDAPTPAQWQNWMRELAGARFGAAFDPARGIVRFSHPQKLRPSLGDIPSGRLLDAHVAFFLERNPGHAQGDELVCIADLNPGNLTPAGRRVVYGASR